MTINSLPPEIVQHFQATLLSTPTFEFRETSKDVKEFFEYAKSILEKKTRSGRNEIKKRKCQALIKEFGPLYEAIKKKEKELETEKNHVTQMPFYSIGFVDRKNEEVFSRTRFKRKIHAIHSRSRANHEIQEVS